MLEKSSPAPAVIVLERTPRWESELRRRFPFAGNRLLICREPAAVLPSLHPRSAGLCLLTLTAEDEEHFPAAVLHLISRLRNDFPHIELVVVWRGEEHSLEWALREQGVQYFLKDTESTAETLERLCKDRLSGWTYDLQELLPELSRW